MPEQKVTEEDAAQALQQLAGVESETPQQEETAPEPSPEETQKAEPVAEETETVEAAEDDLESLKTRLTQFEEEATEKEKRFEERLAASQKRFSENEQILRDRFLRKANTADRALQILRQAKTGDGVSQEEVDSAIREIEGTMNPQSASYVPPQATQPQPQATEDQALVLNAFLNEKGFTEHEATEFGNWIQTEAPNKMTLAEQNVANQSVDGFLRIAHGRWQEGVREKDKQTKRDDAVGAVRGVKEVQRQAARAASSAPKAPRKQPAAEADEIDVKKLTKDDVSALIRQTVEQYR